jgi:uncharacterized protein involved in exopolysaccharide biosynthesis
VYETPRDRPSTDASPPAGRPGSPVDPRRLLLALRRGGRLVAIAALVGTVISVPVGRFLMPQTFVANATLLQDRELNAEVSVEHEAEETATLIASVELPANLAEIRRRLALTSTLGALGARIEAVHRDGENLITLRGSGGSQEEAEELVACTVDVFVERRRAVLREALEEDLERRDHAVASARRSLDEARRTYDAFREEHGVADLPAEMELAIAAAADLRARALIARADADAEGARLDALHHIERGTAPTTVLAEVTSDPGAARLGETRASLAAARSRLTDLHPEVRVLEAEARALDGRRSTEVVTGRTVGRNPAWEAVREGIDTAAADSEAERHRETALLELAREENGRVERLAAVEGRVLELLAEVELAEVRANTAQEERLAVAVALEDVHAGLRLIDPPRAPEWPERSLRRPVALAGPLIGALLGLLFVLFRALAGLRAHTASEISFWSGLPTLASSEWPGAQRGIGVLATDLVRIGCLDAGQVLVVSLGENSWARSLAATLSRRATPRLAVGRDETRHGVKAHRGTLDANVLRRAARQADRVLVLVPSGALSGPALLGLSARLGRTEGVGLVVVGVGLDLANALDRVGSWDRPAARPLDRQEVSP